MCGASDNISALSSSQSQTVAIKTDSWFGVIPRERQRRVDQNTVVGLPFHELYGDPPSPSMKSI